VNNDEIGYISIETGHTHHTHTHTNSIGRKGRKLQWRGLHPLKSNACIKIIPWQKSH
jgi:hypothetical protein